VLDGGVLSGRVRSADLLAVLGAAEVERLGRAAASGAGERVQPAPTETSTSAATGSASGRRPGLRIPSSFRGRRRPDNWPVGTGQEWA
jgi:hypothetical protein